VTKLYTPINLVVLDPCRFLLYASTCSTDTNLAFLLITSKLSDVWGLKSLLISCAFLFLVFSMACGSAQSMVQL
jgi:MFS family permease